MDIRTQTLDCKSCGQQHHFEIDFDSLTPAQLARQEPVMTFRCDRVARMYRVHGFALDTRVKSFGEHGNKEHSEQLAESLKTQWGSSDFEEKLARFVELDLSLLGIPDEYYELLREIVDTYCSGYFYPAMTAAGALGERILNRLILKTRDYFKESPHYKKIYRKESFDHWDLPISLLGDWKVISADVANAFNNLKTFRNQAIHYNEGYDFAENSKIAVSELARIINLQFNYIQRRDIFWVFDVPGEIWLKSTYAEDPFVKEFVIPHCAHISAYCEPGSQGINAPLAPLTDEEFIEARRQKPRGS